MNEKQFISKLKYIKGDKQLFFRDGTKRIAKSIQYVRGEAILDDKATINIGDVIQIRKY